MKSIMHNKDDGTCYICMKSGDYSGKRTEEHHIFYGTSNRKNSTKTGLMVYLCHKHHRGSSDGVHFNKAYDIDLKQEAQREYEKNHTREEFMKIFGRNWL